MSDICCIFARFFPAGTLNLPSTGSPTRLAVVGRAEASVACQLSVAVLTFATRLPNASGIGGIGRRARLRIWFSRV